MVQEGQPFLPTGGFDPWSARNMRLSADGGATPAPRRAGDVIAMRNAYEKGLYFDGDIDIPILDVRPYLEEVLDMHNSHQSFAARQRMLDKDGNASNQVIWFSGGAGRRPAGWLPLAFRTIDEWMGNLREHPWRGVAGNRPAGGGGLVLHRHGRDDRRRAATCGRASSTDGAPGACTQAYPLHSTSRIVAGGPLRGGVYKCALQPVGAAIARGLYGDWQPTAAERARLEQIFPSGVCDYARPDVGRPRAW